MVPRKGHPVIVGTVAFGGAALVIVAAFQLALLRSSGAWRARLLYELTPLVLAAACGALGARWLMPGRCRAAGVAALRGAGLAVLTLALYAPIAALEIYTLEPGWSSALGLASLVFFASFLGWGWLVTLLGALAGLTTWVWLRRAPR